MSISVVTGKDIGFEARHLGLISGSSVQHAVLRPWAIYLSTTQFTQLKNEGVNTTSLTEQNSRCTLRGTYVVPGKCSDRTSVL